MAYIRLSIVRPRKGEEQRLVEVMRKLRDLAAQNEDCQASYLLRPHDDTGEIVRLSIYNSEEAGEHTAQQDSVLALRSELHLLCEPGHMERAFFTIDE